MIKRTDQKIAKMLNAMFSIFKVCRLTEEEVNRYEGVFAHLNVSDPELYKILRRKVDVAKQVVVILKDEKELLERRTKDHDTL